MHYSKRGKIIIASVASVFVLVVAVYFGKPEWFQKNLTPDGEFTLQKEAADIIKTKDSTECQSITNPLYRTVCVNNIVLNKARETLNAEECKNLDDKLISIENCIQEITLLVAAKNENPSLCTALTDSVAINACKLRTVTAIAYKMNDSKLCESYELNENDSDRCYNNILLAPKPNSSDVKFSIKNIDCGLFKGNSAQSDCKIFKEIVSGKTTDFLTACTPLKTNEFKTMCYMNSRN